MKKLFYLVLVAFMATFTSVAYADIVYDNGSGGTTGTPMNNNNRVTDFHFDAATQVTAIDCQVPRKPRLVGGVKGGTI